MNGRLALVTGANSGLGLQCVRALASKNAKVIMACRSLAKAAAIQKKLFAEGFSNIELLYIDLADLRSVDRAAENVHNEYGYLDLLLNNAGLMAPPHKLSKQGYELQFAVNHLGHMALTCKLLPLMRSSPKARIVTVTSGAQYFGRINWDDLSWKKKYDRYAAYGQSKLANVMFALELENRLREQKSSISSLSAHPGLARTKLQSKAMLSSNNQIESMLYELIKPMFQSALMGSLPQLYAATAENAQGGEQYGPGQWGGLRGYPSLCRIAPAALNSKHRKKLWDISENLIGI